jgi:hypothetical protein
MSLVKNILFIKKSKYVELEKNDGQSNTSVIIVSTQMKKSFAMPALKLRAAMLNPKIGRNIVMK